MATPLIHRDEKSRYQAVYRILTGVSIQQTIPNDALVAMYRAGDPTVRRLITESIGYDRLWALLDVDTNGVRQCHGQGRPVLPVNAAVQARAGVSA